MAIKRRRWPALLLVVCLFAGIAGLVALAVGTKDGSPGVPDCGEGPTVPGIDVSYHQDKINWPKVRKAGIRFAFIRVSDGTTVEDPRFDENWANAKHAHVLRGAYQFFRPEQSPTAQADLLIAAIARDGGELAPVIDVEATGGKPPAQIAKAIQIWISRVRARLGVEPIIYTSPEFWREAVGGADFTTQKLWLAHYTEGCPRVPSPWTAWTYWQYSKTGRIDGIRGDVDLNVFAGTIDELRRR